MPAEPGASPSRTITLKRVALGSYVSLIALTLLWEGWLVPKGPPGLWLMLKSLPLLLPLFGLLRGRLRSYVYASLLLLLYLTEGLVIAWTEAALVIPSGKVLSVAMTEVVLTLLFFACANFYIRQRRGEGDTLA